MSAALVAAGVMGCGGSESTEAPGLVCGDGTHEENGACRPNDAGTGGTGGQQEDGGTGGAAGDGGSSGSGGSSGTGGSAGTGPVDPTGDCPKGLPGPTLIEVSTPGGVRYCIDATEVTGGQYRLFHMAKRLPNMDPDMAGQPPGCEGNTSYDEAWADGSPTDTQPAFRVDWCDAYMYCQWAGKHLCGAVGGGTLTSEADMNDPEKSEWYNACSSGGQYAYPYGDTYEPTTCNTKDYGGVGYHALDVSSMALCHGRDAPFDNIYDMSGNVWEWVDRTEAGEKGTVGGSFGEDEGYGTVSCRSGLFSMSSWYDTAPSLGFRCCGDVVE